MDFELAGTGPWREVAGLGAWGADPQAGYLTEIEVQSREVPIWEGVRAAGLEARLQ